MSPPPDAPMPESTTTLRIVFPAGHLGAHGGDDWLDLAMRVIAVGFGTDDEWSEKYGTDYENDVFLMKPYCWCEKEGECPWCTGCGVYQDQNACALCADPNLTLEQRRAAPQEQGCDYSAGRGIFARFAPYQHDRSRNYYDPPNFWFKPDDFRVTWYKYIGRDMATNTDVLPTDMLARVFASHPEGRTLESVVAELERRTEATQARWDAMIAKLNAQFARSPTPRTSPPGEHAAD